MSTISTKKDLTGMRFGKLVALYEIPKDERKSKNFSEYVCKCDCGRVKRVRRDNLRNNCTRSCGCLQKEINKINMEKFRKELIGKRFGRLVVDSEVPRDEWKDKKKREFFCVCDCGNVTKVRRASLINGNTKSCGCLKQEIVQNQGEDLSGQTFGELTAIRRVENQYNESGSHKTMWLFRCSCGREIVASAGNVKHGLSKSCGHVGKSRAEHEMSRLLDQNGIHYDIQATFDDLVNPATGHKLRYDFKIYRNDGSFFIVEHHGVQHLRETEDDFGKLQRDVTDKIKKDYCIANGITLYVTLYNEDYMTRLKEIIESEIAMEGDAYESEVKTG